MNEYPSRYSPSIIAHWQAIGNILASEPDVISVLLLGSAARGELAYAEVDGRLEIFSDYELLVVTERRLPVRQRQHIGVQLAALERQFGQRNPLFHIDVIFRQRRRLRTMPRIIFTYELKANGRVLRGKDVRPLLPEVTLANLDLRNANEILIKRLWAILLYMPRRLLYGPLTPLEEMVWGYVLCRNALDLTTVLLPHLGVLLPSYTERVKYLAAHYDKMPLGLYFGEGFPAFLVACLRERQSFSFSEPLSIRYAKTIGYLITAFNFLFNRPDMPLEALLRRLVTHHHLFNEWPISRGEWANLARLSARPGRTPLAAWRWLRLPKKGIAAAGLLAAHQALIAYQSGQHDEANEHLFQSARLLARIAIVPPPPLRGDFAARWLVLRRAWGDFWQEYIRLGDPKYRSRFDFVTEWQDD